MHSPRAEPHGSRKTLLIVDDHPILCLGLTTLIESEPDLAVEAAVGTRAAALEAMRNGRPDLVIIDLVLGDEDGLDLVKEIKARYPKIPTLVLSMRDEALYAERALSAGALGYVAKTELDTRVLGAIRRTLAGEAYMSEAVQRRLAARYLGGNTLQTASPVDALSDRELQVFWLIGQGRPTRQIAGSLSRSIKTVESHIEHIKNKLAIQSAAELARRATHWVETGRVPTQDSEMGFYPTGHIPPAPMTFRPPRRRARLAAPEEPRGLSQSCQDIGPQQRAPADGS
jgi:DNA-binding NarL/FixJ family response regulator